MWKACKQPHCFSGLRNKPLLREPDRSGLPPNLDAPRHKYPLTRSMLTQFNIEMADQQEAEDLQIWKKSASQRTDRPSSQWLFGEGSLHICEETGIKAIYVSSQVYSELALFDMMHCFWAIAQWIGDSTVSSHCRRMDRYHSLLHKQVTQELLNDCDKSTHQPTPPLLRPWLNRTLLLYTHDDKSREKFKEKFKENAVHWGEFVHRFQS